ncbi:MBL fold metallo-hydrolase [Massilia sp. PAMC28688]|uniref:MBL fold metallo-hydrolase n=1 Tax=Massilia sp. PAMC28688 TaxID=2861283 RepID=UPI001C62E2A2|nr:MBL fold metallo-hydrolase [Massilia sp. PAMC28688]QYF94197.1 MBL fold metallo-hydrolase [Massilia sp. PAMC28688]
MAITISRILHAGYVFTCGETVIAFDPIVENPFSRNCHAFPDVAFDHAQIARLRLAAVFISHYHDDHCSLDSLVHLDRATPIYMYCLFEEMFDMIRALGFTQVQQVRTNEPIRVGAFDVIARQALDADVDSMFQIQAEGLNILNVVDAWIDSDCLARYADSVRWDMVLWPFQTMRELAVLSPGRAQPVPEALPEEWFEQLAMLAPRYLVPSSCQFVQEPWSWYRHAYFPVSYRRFAREMAAALPGTQVVRLNPSVSVTLDQDGVRPAPPLPWVQPVGEQDVDYHYDPLLPVPSTASIARRFGKLTDDEQALVDAYCSAGLLEKYRAMQLDEESYFARPRVWQLSVFDHEGTARPYWYRVHGDMITSIAPGSAAPAWTTEVPAAKLHGALALGESLTTMYMRINGGTFDDAIEADLQHADLLDDPLVRTLFNDIFGAYQAAQLRRLQGA